MLSCPPPAHPMAKPGFGKRNAPDQTPRTAHDFAQLPKREASIAAFIDRLPEGAAMDVKTLAKVLPDYGQQACRTALQRLRDAGYLFYRPVAAVTECGVRWVTQTFFSRTARPKAWWKRFERDELPAEGGGAPRARRGARTGGRPAGFARVPRARRPRAYRPPADALGRRLRSSRTPCRGVAGASHDP
ncbi:hypothetical protein GCM10020000_37940 [Streptomyces olivoverticillatus]